MIDPKCKWNAKTFPSEEFNLQLCNHALNLRKQQRAKATKLPPGALWDEHDISLWQTKLGYAPADVTRQTLGATTKVIELAENNSSYTVMRDHFKKRFPGLDCKRVQDVAFCDFFRPQGIQV